MWQNLELGYYLHCSFVHFAYNRSKFCLRTFAAVVCRLVTLTTPRVHGKWMPVLYPKLPSLPKIYPYKVRGEFSRSIHVNKDPAFYSQTQHPPCLDLPTLQLQPLFYLFYWYSLSPKCLALSDITLHKPDDNYIRVGDMNIWCNPVVYTYLPTYINTYIHTYT